MMKTKNQTANEPNPLTEHERKELIREARIGLAQRQRGPYGIVRAWLLIEALIGELDRKHEITTETE